MRNVTVFFGILFFLGLTTLIGFNWVFNYRILLAPTLWAFAMLLVGTFFGFLFGYPRTHKTETVSAPAPSARNPSPVGEAKPDEAPRPKPNAPPTYLEDIIDWLDTAVRIWTR